jgi:uncharacterized membrane protein
MKYIMEASIMDKKVIGYFKDNGKAQEALRELKEKGFNEISILGNEKGDKSDDKSGNKGRNDATFGTLTSGTVTGGAVGGLAGLAMGAGLLFIPGIGPILALGPLAAALGGAVTGGIGGALIDYGIPADQSNFYETKIKEGNTVMVLKADEHKIDEVAKILRNHGAQDVKVH